MWKKVIQWTLAVIFGVVTLSSVAFIVWALNSSDTETQADESESQSEQVAMKPKETKEEPTKSGSEELFDSTPFEEEFRSTIHHMTHQKVIAVEKWGHVQITEERINKMLEIAKESDYDDKEFYITALKKWQNGDFTNAVYVHNRIWEKEDGTIGRASERMTTGQEQQYINKHFE